MGIPIRNFLTWIKFLGSYSTKFQGKKKENPWYNFIETFDVTEFLFNQSNFQGNFAHKSSIFLTIFF